ncbi:uncharacterized protein LOC126846529 isoform X2 [Adelges cooleyi]|uniref:uncharacterized protein LOC126846529 isoform X2 n=1 Tax=Adelges cooleyi TaxID=133065 RepID=UPI00217FF092|nr:uncharacterized protein LOC126846529 isoform X2 [Adelges cooleyi]
MKMFRKFVFILLFTGSYAAFYLDSPSKLHCIFSKYMLDYFDLNESYFEKSVQQNAKSVYDQLSLRKHGENLQKQGIIVMAMLDELRQQKYAMFPTNLMSVNLYLSNITGIIEMYSVDNGRKENELEQDDSRIRHGFQLIYKIITDELKSVCHKNCERKCSACKAKFGLRFENLKFSSVDLKNVKESNSLSRISEYLDLMVIQAKKTFEKNIETKAYEDFYPSNMIVFKLMNRSQAYAGVFDPDNRLDLMRYVNIIADHSVHVVDLFETIKSCFNGNLVKSYQQQIIAASLHPIFSCATDYVRMYKQLHTTSNSVIFATEMSELGSKLVNIFKQIHDFLPYKVAKYILDITIKLQNIAMFHDKRRSRMTVKHIDYVLSLLSKPMELNRFLYDSSNEVLAMISQEKCTFLIKKTRLHVQETSKYTEALIENIAPLVILIRSVNHDDMFEKEPLNVLNTSIIGTIYHDGFILGDESSNTSNRPSRHILDTGKNERIGLAEALAFEVTMPGMSKKSKGIPSRVKQGERKKGDIHEKIGGSSLGIIDSTIHAGESSNTKVDQPSHHSSFREKEERDGQGLILDETPGMSKKSLGIPSRMNENERKKGDIHEKIGGSSLEIIDSTINTGESSNTKVDQPSHHSSFREKEERDGQGLILDETPSTTTMITEPLRVEENESNMNSVVGDNFEKMDGLNDNEYKTNRSLIIPKKNDNDPIAGNQEKRPTIKELIASYAIPPASNLTRLDDDGRYPSTRKDIKSKPKETYAFKPFYKESIGEKHDIGSDNKSCEIAKPDNMMVGKFKKPKESHQNDYNHRRTKSDSAIIEDPLDKPENTKGAELKPRANSFTQKKPVDPIYVRGKTNERKHHNSPEQVSGEAEEEKNKSRYTTTDDGNDDKQLQQNKVKGLRNSYEEKIKVESKSIEEKAFRGKKKICSRGSDTEAIRHKSAERLSLGSAEWKKTLRPRSSGEVEGEKNKNQYMTTHLPANKSEEWLKKSDSSLNNEHKYREKRIADDGNDDKQLQQNKVKGLRNSYEEKIKAETKSIEDKAFRGKKKIVSRGSDTESTIRNYHGDSTSLHCLFSEYILGYLDINERYFVLKHNQNTIAILLDNYDSNLRFLEHYIMAMLDELRNYEKNVFAYDLMTANLYLNNLAKDLNIISTDITTAQFNDVESRRNGFFVNYKMMTRQLSRFINSNCHSYCPDGFELRFGYLYKLVRDLDKLKSDKESKQLLADWLTLKNLAIEPFKSTLDRGEYGDFHPANMLFYDLMSGYDDSATSRLLPTDIVAKGKQAVGAGDLTKFDDGLQAIRKVVVKTSRKGGSHKNIISAFYCVSLNFNADHVRSFQQQVLAATVHPVFDCIAKYTIAFKQIFSFYQRTSSCVQGLTEIGSTLLETFARFIDLNLFSEKVIKYLTEVLRRLKHVIHDTDNIQLRQRWMTDILSLCSKPMKLNRLKFHHNANILEAFTRGKYNKLIKDTSDHILTTRAYVDALSTHRRIFDVIKRTVPHDDIFEKQPLDVFSVCDSAYETDESDNEN